MTIDETIKQLDFDAYYLKVYVHRDVYGKFKHVYLNQDHETYIRQWLQDNYHKLSEQHKQFVNLNVA
jgi:hypothetical protein